MNVKRQFSYIRHLLGYNVKSALPFVTFFVLLGFLFSDKIYPLVLDEINRYLTPLMGVPDRVMAVFGNVPVVGYVLAYLPLLTKKATYVDIAMLIIAIVVAYYVLMFTFKRKELLLNFKLRPIRTQLQKSIVDDPNADPNTPNLNGITVQDEKKGNQLVRRSFGIVNDDGNRVVIVPCGRRFNIQALVSQRCEQFVPNWIHSNLGGNWNEPQLETNFFGQFYVVEEKENAKKAEVTIEE
jgi:hypothetical protein